MKELTGACLFGQSGGPTSVINASAYGIITAAKQSPYITDIFAACHGIEGILNDRLFDIRQEDDEELKLLLQTPSSIFGSCRYKLKDYYDDETDYRRILEVFQKRNIRYFFYIGGNDSMDTCNKISKYLKLNNYECRVIGVPKTIDNDLYGTDHCPGYGSAARYVATSCMEIRKDTEVYPYPTVCIVEIMGRNAGWLTAAAAIGNNSSRGADLVYLPEIVFDLDKFLADVENIFKTRGSCVIAVSEGVKDKSGMYISEYSENTVSVDSFGHKQMGGVSTTLVNFVRERLGTKKIRSIEFSLMQRCAAHCASATDIEESYQAGRTALMKAVEGYTDKMVCFARTTDVEGQYVCEYTLNSLTLSANTEKKVPREWINEQGNNMNEAFFDYALPLIQGENPKVYDNGLLRMANLKKVFAE